MEKENTRKYIIIGLLMLLTFVLGMVLQKNLSDRQYAKVLNNYVKQVNDSIQRFEFNATSYSPFQTNTTLKQPFACILGKGDEVERIFWNAFVPAISRKPVCFVNNMSYENQTGG